jgi:uncharacterized protein YciI
MVRLSAIPFQMKTIICLIILLCLFAKANGQFTFVFLNKKPDAEKLSEEQSKAIMAGHFANMERLAKEKKLVAAGPFEGGGGIFILNTTNPDTAKFWISPDTGIKANRWNVELLPYSPRVGNVCAVSAPYTMVMYSFARFFIDDETSRKNLKLHNRFVKKLASQPDVITEGVFEKTGGILIAKSDITKEQLESDPAFQNHFVSYDIKKLYIAKGSFCEK